MTPNRSTGLPGFRIANRRVGADAACFVVAEAGINHGGSLSAARKLVDAAAEAGVDAVKFQTGRATETVTTWAPMAAYQTEAVPESEGQFQMVRNLEFTDEEWVELAGYAKDSGIIFFSKPAYVGAVDLLVAMGCPVIKIGSGDVTHLSLLDRVARTGLPIILSTGMCNLGDVELALSAINGIRDHGPVALLHCTSNYPSEPADVNLQAMDTLRQAFRLPVGYSDHTLGSTIPLAAVARGACIIEKHFTLDRSQRGPDHRVSLEPGEMGQLVKEIRIVEAALGDGVKRPAESEREVARVARKSIVARQHIPPGTKITREMLAYKRPGNGLQEQYLPWILGRSAKVGIRKDELIGWDML